MKRIQDEEIMALYILNEFLNIDISNFKKSESPDWINVKVNIGIEVTTVDDSRKFFSELEKVDINKIKNKVEFRKRYIKNGGYTITKETAQMLGLTHSMIDIRDEYFYITYSDDNNFKKINKKINEKTKKLNQNFKVFEDNRLFIFATIRYNEDMIKEELKYLIEENEKFEVKYSTIYLVLLRKLCVFDLKNNNYICVELDEKNNL